MLIRQAAFLLTLIACVAASTMPATAACEGRAPQETLVATIEELQSAIDAACPGDVIEAIPGTYKGRIWARSHVQGSAEQPIVIRAQEPGSVTIDGDGTNITVKFTGAGHIEFSGFRVTGGGYHGIFFDEGANNILIENNEIFDNHRIRPLQSHAEIKGSGGGGRPHDITIRGNRIFHEQHPEGGNFQGIDCNLCTRFSILANHIFDIREPTDQPFSLFDRGSCIQMKSASEGTIIDGNLIERCHIGIVLGGEGLETPENIDGIVTNNVILDSTAIGLAVVNATNAQILYNTILGTVPGIHFEKDLHFPDGRNSGVVMRNLISGSMNRAYGDKIEARGNRFVHPRDDAGHRSDLEAVPAGQVHSGQPPELIDNQAGPCPSRDFLGLKRDCENLTLVGALAGR